MEHFDYFATPVDRINAPWILPLNATFNAMRKAISRLLISFS